MARREWLVILTVLSVVASTAIADPPKPLKAPFTKEQAKAAQEAWAKYLGKKVEEEIDIGGGLKMVFELIPPGTFMMGSPEEELKLKGDDKANDDEVPRHEVTISKPFYLGKYLVTQAEYVQLTGKENPSFFSADGGGKDRLKGADTNRFPVEGVDWKQAAECASTLKNKLGEGWKNARLPSEAMWEYACRAGTETRWHVGNRLTTEQAQFGQKGEGRLNRTRIVGLGAANAFGLLDMHGNVYQWCRDWYGKYSGNSQIDPEGPDNGSERVVRGGCWVNPAEYCRSAFRYEFIPLIRDQGLGLRLALVPSGQDK